MLEYIRSSLATQLLYNLFFVSDIDGKAYHGKVLTRERRSRMCQPDDISTVRGLKKMLRSVTSRTEFSLKNMTHQSDSIIYSNKITCFPAEGFWTKGQEAGLKTGSFSRLAGFPFSANFCPVMEVGGGIWLSSF